MGLAKNTEAPPPADKITKSPEGPRYLKRTELAKVFRISLRKVDSMIANNEIPFRRFGRAIRFRLEEVEQHLSASVLARRSREEKKA